MTDVRSVSATPDATLFRSKGGTPIVVDRVNKKAYALDSTGAVFELATATVLGAIDDTPVNGETTHSISSNWAFDHVAAADPHTGYRLESQDHNHQSTGAQAGQLDHGLALTGLTDDDHSQYLLASQATDRATFTANWTDLTDGGGTTLHTHASTGISDFNEAVDDRVDALIQDGTGISWSYNDALNTLTPTVSLASFSTTDLAEGTNLYFTDERAQDAVGTILTDTATINLTYTDATPTITADVIQSALDHGSIGGLSDNDHPQYLLVADIDDTPVNGELAQPISSNWAYDHEQAADPHPGYLTPAEGNAAYQPLDATLTALAALTIAADSLTIGTGADAFSQTTFAANTFPAKASTGSLVAKSITDFGLSLVDDADNTAARTTLGLGTIATQAADSVNIDGGAIDGTTIGATTAAAITGTTITANTGFSPDANDGAYLGQAGTAFSDLFLAEGGVINWDSGDCTLTQTGNVLALEGAALMIGDTANANNTLGLTIKTTSTNHIETLKHGSLGTGLTTGTLNNDVETDDFFTRAAAGADGGVREQYLTASSKTFAHLCETYSGAPATTDTSSSLGAMNWYVGQHDGANGLVDMAADSNGFVWGEITAAGARATRMLLKADDGELHLGNTTLVALDDEDDIMAVRGLQITRTEGRGIVPNPMDAVAYSYDKLREIGVVGPKDEQGEFLIRVQPYLNLHDGAIWQLYERCMRLAERVQMLESKLAGMLT